MPVRSQFESETEWLEHLRLWFAGQALMSALDTREPLETARRCYEIADAMLEARGK